MIKASRNQLANTKNQYQGDTWKVLTVCSAGLLRSPTAANILHKEYGFNTRACGVAKDFALIPLSQALIEWADEIVFMCEENYTDMDEEETKAVDEKVVTVLNIPDDYNWGDKELEQSILFQYKRQIQEGL